MVAISWIFNLLVRAFYVGLLDGLLDAPHGSMDGQLSGKTMGKPWVLTQENPWESPLKILTNTLIMDLSWMLVGRCCLFSA